jgi:hypothetical protein
MPYGQGLALRGWVEAIWLAALRAFWAGSAGPLDRLFGGPDESGLRIGEMLLEVSDELSRPRSWAVMGADDGLLGRSAV